MKLTISGKIIIDIEPDEEKKPGFLWTLKWNNGTIVQYPTMLALPNDQFVTASIQPVDAKGNPAKVDGIPAWSSSSPSIANVTNISADGLSADVVPGDQLGTCQINVQADADLGEGVNHITGVLDVQTVAGSAVGFTISTSAPQPLPPAQAT